MKKNKVFNLMLMFALLLTGGLTAFGQYSESGDNSLLEDRRPFDFSDKHYEENGVDASLIFDRRNGVDKLSVFDTNNDPKYRGVRIIATSPAYDSEGNLIFWTRNGELFDQSFTNNDIGRQAFEAANRYPLYQFPSEFFRNQDRQAALIDTSGGYFQKNPLGLSVVVLVEYTHNVDSSRDPILTSLAEKNGKSLDGTPIIRTLKELENLTRRGLIRQTVRGINDKSVPSYSVAPVIEDPTSGAITRDAFLTIVLKENGKPLDAEQYMLNYFECLQKTGGFCKQ
ncbi:MAG: hypothetical protein R2747_01100 [Pyrinomonadaceae bacterium]